MITGHSKQKYVTGQKLNSSETLGWSSVLAESWQHKPGALDDVCPKETEIAIMLAGKAKVTRKGNGEYQEAVGIPGTIWLCPAGILEEDVVISGNMEECVHLYIDQHALGRFAEEELDVDPARSALPYLGGFQDPFIEQIGRLIKQEIESPTATSRLLIDSLRGSLSNYLLHKYSGVNRRAVGDRRQTRALDRARLDRVRDYMRANIDQSITLDDLAREACLSTFHFNRAFKQATGQSPVSYLNRERIEVAKSLLQSPERSIVDIALTTGFGSQDQFAKAFKKFVHLTPRQYRQRSM